MACMHKTTLYLDEALYERVLRMAEERGVSQAMLVREAVASYTAGARKKPRSVGLGRSGKPGRGTLSERAEEHLAGFGEERPARKGRR